MFYRTFIYMVYYVTYCIDWPLFITTVTIFCFSFKHTVYKSLTQTITEMKPIYLRMYTTTKTMRSYCRRLKTWLLRDSIKESTARCILYKALILYRRRTLSNIVIRCGWVVRAVWWSLRVWDEKNFHNSSEGSLA